jgi:hypothetical protein
MTDQPAVPPTPPIPDPPHASIPFNIGEEFGTAKKSLPPTSVLVIAVAAVAVVIAVAAFLLRSKSSASGTIDDVVAVEVPDQGSVMVAINLTVRNTGSKPYKITEITSDLEKGETSYHDTAASKMDLDRYYAVLPLLKERSLPPLSVEDAIPPGGELKGSIVVSFPISQADFQARKALKVSIMGKNEYVPLVITK